MLRLTKNHTIFEVWNEWAAESVYVDHRPTWDELVFLVTKNWGTNFRQGDVVIPLEEFIKKFIFVEKERHMYTMTAKAKRGKYQRKRGED